MSKHFIFTTPSFIVLELGFLLSSLASAYELFIGDFIWAREEEELRAATQNARERGLTSSRPLYDSRQYGSLSPRGGRGRLGGREDETSSLLQGKRYTRRLQETTEEDSFPSPGDMRSVDIGRGSRGGSSGDSTRRLFYKLILLSLLSRLLLLPIEFYCFAKLDQENSIPLRILLRTSQSLPHIIFASSLGLLVIFCAQISFAALPPLSPSVSDESDEEETTVPSHEVIMRDSIEEEEENEEESPNALRRRQKDAKRKKTRSIGQTVTTSVSRFLRAVLASKQTFSLWNFIVLTSYSTIFVILSTKNGIPVSQSEIYLWILLTTIYSFLLLVLFYVGTLLLKALSPGLKRRKDSNALAVRLLCTWGLLACIFLERSISFGIAAHTAVVYKDTDETGDRKLYSYRRDALDYGVSELIPVVCLLFMMHRRRRGEMPSDVLIINSFINNVFGSMGVLSASGEEETGEMDAGSSAEGGALGSRRFQSYGGSRQHDSPSNSRVAGIGRAASSSGSVKHSR